MAEIKPEDLHPTSDEFLQSIGSSIDSDFLQIFNSIFYTILIDTLVTLARVLHHVRAICTFVRIDLQRQAIWWPARDLMPQM